ncbi:FecR domain-containing protein [Flavisphingomonas formosensis]|uniref:FecR domain-containing protein n=1 Tax=Flavisphingomonas formosensis TaxID=861534 RepID=UPI0012F72D09|nr:FecR domain-containing protein [Sphingomonas formosensis]
MAGCYRWSLGSATLLVGLVAPDVADAAPVQRAQPVAGTIIAAKGGEQAALVPDPRLRPAEVRQDLKPGDVLRTNAAGTLAIVFADQTQIRLGRNSTLLVKQVSGGAPSALSLSSGSLWARAPRGRTQLSIETPSATAAIRGTDWAISATDRETRLEVFDGRIEFFNQQGTLSVAGGQAAVAEIGKAPSRLVVVNSREREQMLYYFPLDAAFSIFSPSPLSARAARAEHARLMALPAERRSAEDWLMLVETGQNVVPRAQVREDLARARAAGLDAAQASRADFLEGWRLAEDRQWPQAVAALDRARPGLAGHRAAVADYLRFIAARRADPDSEAPLPPFDRDEPAAWLGQAYLAAYAGDLDRAKRLAAEAAARFPEDAEIASIEGSLGVMLDDRAMIERSVARTLTLDPDHPEALRLRGNLKAAFAGDPDAALVDLRRAAALAPANGTGWSDLGNALSERNAMREASAAMRQAIAAEPKDPLARVNHAIVLLDQNRLEEAKAELDRALALDPGLSAAHSMIGRYHLQNGDAKRALDELLAGSAADPAYSEGLMLLGAAYYRRGEYAVALQQIDAADRLDPASATPALIRAAIALDRYDLDTAIRSAREALRRYRAKGGIYANLSENRGTGSYVAGAFRFLDLGDWARYYGDRVFDSFTASAYFDQSNDAPDDPFLSAQSPTGFDPRTGTDTVLSSLMQGLALQPLSVASSNRYLQLFQERFFEVDTIGSVTGANGDARGSLSVNALGLAFSPLPIAYSITASRSATHGPAGDRNDARDTSLTALVGAELTPYDRLTLFGQHDERRTEAPGDFGDTRLGGFGLVRQRSDTLYGVYSHEFGYRHMLLLGGSYGTSLVRTARRDGLLYAPPVEAVIDGSDRQRSRAWSATASWAYGFRDVDLRAGVDLAGVRQRVANAVTLRLNGTPLATAQTEEKIARSFDRAWLDLRATPTRSIILQGRIARSEATVGHRLDWQAGLAIEPAAGQWLRGAYVSATQFPIAFTLAPPRVAGLVPNMAPVPLGGKVKSGIVRWDAEWTPHLFTAVEYQHQHYQAIRFDRPDILMPLCLDDACVIGPADYDFGAGHSDRLTVSANIWLTGNWGLNASYAHSRSALEGPSGDRGAIPFLPRHYARLGVTWTDPRRIKLNASLAYVGSRRSEQLTSRLGDYVSLDAGASWESPDRRFQLDLGITNALDAHPRVATGVPGWGRAVTATLTTRF